MRKNKAEKELMNEDGLYQVKKSKKVNIFAFIVCVLASCLIWIYVMNTQNTEYTKTFTLGVDVINAEELLKDSNLSVYGVSKRNVTVTIKGKKSDVRKYSEKDFRAYIDLSTIEKKGLMTLNVAVETPSAALSVVTVDPTAVEVYADTMTTKTLALMPRCEEEDKLVLSLGAEDVSVKVSGPSTYMENLSYAAVYIPYSEKYSVADNVSTSDIRLFSADDTELSSLYMTFSKETVVVRVDSIYE